LADTYNYSETYFGKKNAIKMNIFFNKPASMFQVPVSCLGGNTKEVDASTLRALVESQLPVPVEVMTLADVKYSLLDRGRVQDAIQLDGTRYMKYQKESNDCDNFSAVLRGRILHKCYLSNVKQGPAFGEIRGEFLLGDKETGSHRMNIVVCKDKKVYLIEPQNGKWYEPKAAKVIWQVWM
jgi:hypothetical protein